MALKSTILGWAIHVMTCPMESIASIESLIMNYNLKHSCTDLLLSDQGDEIWASKKDDNLKLPKTLSSEELAAKILEWA